MSIPKIITIVGPTGVGKTDLAIRLARAFSGEVISADSRQVYRDMPVGTGQPAGEWRTREGERTFFVEEIPHYGIGIVPPDAPYTTADFKKFAEEKIADITKRGKIPIIVGGTGLYFWALLDNLELGGSAPNPVRRAKLDALTLEDAVAFLRSLDSKKADTVDLKNKRRVVRAIEIAESESSLAPLPIAPKFWALQIGLALPRQELYQKIDERIDQQIENGFEAEAKILLEKYSIALPSLSGVGYREWAAYLAGETTRAETIRAIKNATHHYAKRQGTWFKRNSNIRWFAPVVDEEKIVSLVKDFIEKA